MCVVLVVLIAMIMMYIIKKVKSFIKPNDISYYEVSNKPETSMSESDEDHRIPISNELELINVLRNMEPKYFEDFIELLFKLKGYQIIYKSFRKKVNGVREPRSDRWIDMIGLKDNKKIYVQIKKYQSHQVEESIVRDFYGTIVDKVKDNQDIWMIVTTSMLSDHALEFATRKKIRVLEYDGILKEIKEVAKEHRQELEDFLDAYGEPNSQFKQYTRTCPRCFAPMMWRKNGSFYGCMNYYRTGCDYKKK